MRSVILAIALLASTQAAASEVTVSEAWARATAPGQHNGAVYLHITSRQDSRIVAVSTPVAEGATLHSTTNDKGVMKMRELDTLLLPAGQQVQLGAGATHIMLSGLKKPLVAGDSVPLTITIQFTDKRRESVKVMATIVPLTSNQEHHHQH